MKILILEGIPTSGKSSISREISELLGQDRVRAYGESETHIPIIDQPDELHNTFFKSLVQNAIKSNADLVIFDRFHFTQAVRAHTGIDGYADIESLLARHKTLVAHLLVDDAAIAERLKLTAERRDQEQAESFQWGEYFRSKGETLNDVAEHYAAQQRVKMELVNRSKLQSRVFNTTHHEYKAIASQAIREWFNQS